MASRGVKRLAFFVIFLIPVAWYLFLQLFGSNKFALTEVIPITEDCGKVKEIAILYAGDSSKSEVTNYLDRVVYHTNAKGIPLVYSQSNLMKCLNLDADLILANNEGVWGVYELNREGVDQLLTELDVLIIQNTYGEGTSR